MANVTSVKGHFYTTNQELDKDSDAVLEVHKGGKSIGSSSTGRSHGKQWTDGTANDLVVHLT